MKKYAQRLLTFPMPPLMTNIGIIDAERLRFNNLEVINAKFLGAISHSDFMGMSVSTFKDSLTFSIGFVGSEVNRKQIIILLSTLKDELSKILH